MKFKVGDTWVLKQLGSGSREEYEEVDTGAGWLDEMEDSIGQIHVVTRAPALGNPVLRDPLGNEFFYSPNWLEPAKKFKGNK